MRKVFTLLFVISLAFICAAQNNLPPVYEIKTNTAEYLRLNDSNWQMLKDSTGKFTIDQIIQSPFTDQFHFDTLPEKGVNVYWFRYRIKNSMSQKEEIAIPENEPYGDVYTQDIKGRWDHRRTGYNVPWSQRDGLKKTKMVLYTLQPGEELLVYERHKFDYASRVHAKFYVHIYFADKVIQKYYIDNEPSVIPPVIFGIFLVAAFLNLYFFIVVRKRVYLYFSFVTTFVGFKNFLDSTGIFFREHPVTGNYVWYTCYVLSLFFFVHLIRHFLETFKYVPRWDKWLIGVSIYAPVFIALARLHIISMNEAYVGAAGHATVFFFILITFILFLRSPDKSARLKVVSVLPIVFFIGIMIIPPYVASLCEIIGIPIPAFIVWLYDHYPVLELLMFEWLIIFFSVSLFRHFQQLQKQIAFEAVEKERLAKEKEIERSQLIEQQKVTLEKTVAERTAELKDSLNELKSTQAQLIQSEKMASLGELTAGIAHEIQNPLNFVNNFSEVNVELVDELKGERQKVKGERNEVEDEILNDIQNNLQKILYHGKRADAIVKGMLQHSRASTGKKEPTDINALTDEYLRLSYHGMRAKDKNFNATIKTDFDATIGKINVVPQDIGRVLLNLFNNAFYAIGERCKVEGDGYKPSVTVATSSIQPPLGGRGVTIKVTDNGGGIPQKVVDKIFQPFFTTKPTGQGTGLGLSLSYDIIKAHGGEIRIETKEGEGAEFIVQLPI
ncbi:MAG TPA: ATP-binding protein [Chitinophagaceae bacterium]